MWQRCVDNISAQCFPALGLEKQRTNGKFLKITVENKEKNIHDAHPIQLGKILKQYFNDHTEQHRSKNCLILRTKDKKQFQTAMNLKQAVTVNIGGSEEKVVFEELANRNQTTGIVFENSWSQLSEEEIKSELTAEGYDVRNVRKMTKRDKNGQMVQTGTVVITFDAEELPDRVKLCGVSYRIRQYFPSPLICGRCLKIGHIKAKCQSEHEICRDCGDAKKEMHECLSSPTCPNCQIGDNDHKPNNKGCAAIEFEKAVINYRTINKTSIFEAQLAVRKLIEKKNHEWNPNSKSTATNSDCHLNENAEDKNKTQTVNEEISYQENELQKLNAENQRLERLIKQTREAIAQREELIKELEMLQQKDKDTKARLSQLQNKSRNTRSVTRRNERSRSIETKRDTRDATKLTIAKTATHPPRNSKPIDQNTVQQLYGQMTQHQKDKFSDKLTKAQQKKAVVNWYISDSELIPVEVTEVLVQQ